MSAPVATRIGIACGKCSEFPRHGCCTNRSIMKIRVAPFGLLAAFALFASPAVAFADCPFAPDADALATLGGDVAAAAAAGAPAPCTATLGQVLQDANKTPEGRAYVQATAALVGAQLGRVLSPAEIDALLADPSAIDKLMTVDLASVVAGLRKAQAASDAAGRTNATPPAYKLPSTVDFAAAPSFFDNPKVKPSPIFGNVVHGDNSSDISDADAKSNKAIAEIFTRLAMNTGRPAADRFTVNYGGHAFQSVDGLTKALAKNGNTVTATVNQRIANFIDLHIANPDGTYCDVQTAVMIRTGYHAPDGSEITVPATHTGLHIEIHGPDANAAVAFFQGVDGTGFFPEGLSTKQAWVGGKDVETYGGAQAMKAISAAGLWTNVVNDITSTNHLLGEGYGRTGICDDSVAMIQKLVTGRTTIYPLSMDHDLVGAYLDAKAAAGGSLASRYATLRSTMNSLPLDTSANDSAASRIVSSLPFGDGPTPFPGADAARVVLTPGS
jgi:hypothetical protein